MAKRKRLTPAQAGYLEAGALAPVGRAPLGPAPIAQVAGDSSARAALEELSGVLESARADGRMIELLPLDTIDDGYLVRDRLVQDEDEMGALIDSIRARGQQIAVEVAPLPEPRGQRIWGLISGWRRLTALRRLHDETGDDRFATIRARMVAPETAQAAYVAMVEENEIRANLSFYERARIALRAMREGVYPSQRAALQGLFGTTTRSRRSKIGSFIALVDAFDDDLKHPTAISEKLGLALAREMVRDPVFVSDVRIRLESLPDRDVAAEMRLLAAAVAAQQPEPPAPEPAAPQAGKKARPDPAPATRDQITPGIAVSFHPGRNRIELTGSGVDEALCMALKEWLAAR